MDAIFDLVGGANLQAVAELLADRSKLVSAGDPATAGSLGGAFIERTQNSEGYQALPALVVAGAFAPTITATYPFERVAEALAEVEGGHARGKVVIQMS